MADRLLCFSEAHLIKSSFHYELVEKVATLEVIQPRQIIQTVNLFEVHEKMNSVDSHRLEVSAELDVPNYLY